MHISQDSGGVHALEQLKPCIDIAHRGTVWELRKYEPSENDIGEME